MFPCSHCSTALQNIYALNRPNIPRFHGFNVNFTSGKNNLLHKIRQAICLLIFKTLTLIKDHNALLPSCKRVWKMFL